MDLKEYGRWKLSSQLSWLVNERPTIYNVIKPNGEKHLTVFNKKDLEKYKDEGYTIEEGDLDKFITEVKSSIERMEDEKK